MRNQSFIAILIIVFYAIVKFCFTEKLEMFGAYAAYLFEIIFVAVVGYRYRHRLNFKLNWIRELKVGFAPALLAGFLVFTAAKPFNIAIPFDLRSSETILFLLLLGPILEEFIFRVALWQPLIDLGRQKRRYALVGTSLLFSYGHFHAYWFVPEQFHHFIFYQSSYTILLGFYCGSRLIRTNSIIAPILVHIGFNLGFFIGSLV